MATEALAFEQTDEQTTIGRTARQIILQAAMLGVLADNVLRHPGGGIAWTAWIVALVLVVYIVARRGHRRLTVAQQAWLTTAVVFAAGVAWRDSEDLQAYNTLASLAALSFAGMSLSGVPATSIWSARLRDVILGGIAFARDAAFGMFPLLRQAEVGAALRSSAAARRPALRAALLTAPIVVVFSMLLSRADPVFGAIFQLPDFRFDDLVSHVIVAGFFAWTSAGFLRGALLERSTLPLQAIRGLSIGTIEVTAALGSVAALFAVFVGLQMRWLFGGGDVVLATTGLSLAEYARRGFFELIGVAALVLPLVLGTRAMLDDDAALQRHRNLSLVLLGLLGAIMTSAALRMWLYVTNYGLSTDRLYALAFMVWLALVFVAMVPTVLRGWTRPFAALTVVSGFATLLALNAVNPEAVVARVNVGRSSARGVDYEYLARLSGDATSIVAPALASAEPSPSTCVAAKRLWEYWTRPGRSTSNLGAIRGRGAVSRHLTFRRVQELCVNGDGGSR
jgi:hypothetical protein